MPKLVNKGSYYEIQNDNSEIFASILNSLAGGMQQIIGGLKEKKLQEQKLQETRLDMQAKINAMDPDIQESLLQGSPELRRFLIDPNQLKRDPEQRKALDKGEIVPLMPKIRGRTPLEQATLFDRQQSGKKESFLANKAQSEAELAESITGSRLALMKSENPYERILGLTGEVMTSDKLEAMMTGINDPQAAFTKYMGGVPGSMQFKTQAMQKVEAQLLSEINPQTPEEMQGVKDAAAYVAGLGPQPKKMPKNLQAKAQDIDKWRVRVQQQGNEISQTRLNMEVNGKIHALGDQLSIRLKGTGKEGEAFSIAEGMIRKGTFPENLPPDIMALADQEHKLVNINMDKLKYEQQLQQSPKLQMLLDLAGKSATSGDDKGAQQYIKMAEEERKKVFGEDKPNPDERKRFWNTILTASAAAVPGGTGIANSIVGTSIEQKAAMLKWAGSTTAEVSEFLSTVPGRVENAASKGMITSPGQSQLIPNSGPVIAPEPKRLPATAPPATTTPSAPLNSEQLQAMENMLKELDKAWDQGEMTYEKRSQMTALLDMIEEVKAGKRPFSDLITPDK